jgi:predicted transcriptional regulator
MSFTQSSVLDVLEALINRIEYIWCVLDGPREKKAFVTEIDAARSTVDRAINDLETVTLIEQVEDGYQATTMGRIVARDFFNSVDTLDRKYQEYDHAPGDIPVLGVIDTVRRRIELMDCLREVPKDKPTLVDDLGMSRATVDRGLRELESVGLVEYTAGRFGITPVGELTMSALLNLIETIEQGLRLNPFLRWIPGDDFDIDLRLLADAEMLLPEPSDPWSMMNEHVNKIEETHDGKVIQPLASLHAMETAYDRIVNEGATGATVVESSVAAMFQSNSNYAELVEEMIATERFDLFVYDGTIPYYIGVFDETVQIGVDEDGIPRAILETDSPEVRKWAESKYEEYKQQSELVGNKR